MRSIRVAACLVLCAVLSGASGQRRGAGAFRYDFPPGVGNLNLLVLLVRFADQEPEVSPERFGEIFFSSGKLPGGSVAEYMKEVSYGKLRITGEVRGWYTAENGHDYYGGDMHGHDALSYPRNMGRLVEEAVSAAIAEGVDFSNYDNSGDGHVDGLIVIHTGRGGDTTGRRSDIWTTTHYLSMVGTQPLRANGKTIDRFSVIQEIRKPGIELPIGFICHELGHMMGLPDLGDKSGRSAGIGRFGVMGTGYWGADDPTRPLHFCAWSKSRLGWLEPTVVGSDTTVVIPDIESHAVSYRLNCTGDNEYYLLENRVQKGYDSGLCGSGLLIWHVDESVLTENNFSCVGLCPDFHYIVALEQADGLNELEKNLNHGDPGDFFKSGQVSRSRWAGDTGSGKDGLSGAHSLSYEGRPCRVSVQVLDSGTTGIEAGIKVNDLSGPSPLKPRIVITDHRIERLRGTGILSKRGTRGLSLNLRLLNIGASAKNLTVSARAAGIDFERSITMLKSIGAGEERWIEEAFIFKEPLLSGAESWVNFKFTLSFKEQSYTEVLKKRIVAGKAEILLVDDTGIGLGYFYGKRLEQIEEPFHSVNAVDQGIPDKRDIEGYKTIIWLAPLEARHEGDILDERGKELIKIHLANGGNLLFIAPMLQTSGKDFWPNVLRIKDSGILAGIEGLRGYEGDIISRGHIMSFHNFYYPRLNPHSYMEPGRDALPVYRNLKDRVVGVRYPGDGDGNFRLAVFSFPVEALGAGHQCAILKRTLQFFRLPPGAPLADKLEPAEISAGAGRITLEVAGINFAPGMKAMFETKGLTLENIEVTDAQNMEITINIGAEVPAGKYSLILEKPGITPVRSPGVITVKASQ